MNKRFLILLPIVVSGVLVLIVGLWRKISQRESRHSTNPTLNLTATGAQPKNAAPSFQSAGATTASTKGELMRDVLTAYNHKDIEFYGKVVDQYGTPIPDVVVTGSVIYNSGISSGVQKAQTRTDSDGLFFFKGMKGRTFDCGLRKPGFQTMPEGDAWDYTELVPEGRRHHPDPKNPVVLKMWKLQGGEPLVHFEHKYFPLTADGAPVRIDLSTGKQVTSGGDIIFRINHMVLPRGAVPELHFEWHARIEVMEGGFIESDQRLMYLAPETGYHSTLTIDMPAESASWDHTVDRSFYIRIRENLFGHLEMHLNANQRGYDPSNVTLQWWLNPKPGSRNLEVDPQK